MKNVSEIKQQKEDKYSAMIKECLVFFAFSNEQFEKNKTPLADGEKYVSMGMGGYLPKSKAKAWSDGTDEIDAWFKNEMKDAKLRRENIAYELANHEAYYVGSIESTLDALGSDYTREEVLAIYFKEKKNVVFD